jgi:hypothetical protein
VALALIGGEHKVFGVMESNFLQLAELALFQPNVGYL